MFLKLALAVVAAFCLGHAHADEPETMILRVHVNEVAKGDLLLAPQPDSARIWVKGKEFPALGLELTDLPVRRIAGADFFALDPSPRLKLDLDLDLLELRITAAPELLGRQVISLRQGEVLPPSPTPGFHAYLNYAIGVQAVSGMGVTKVFDLAPTVGIGDWVLRSEHQAVVGARGSHAERLRSYAQRDFTEPMIRVQVGDVSPFSGAFGRAGQLGGISVSRLFDLQPGFVRAPALNHSGALAAPATAEIFIDGARVRTVPLRPGLFEFRDLYYFAGLRNVEVVLSDATGRRESLALPFYFSDQILKAGLHEFSYSLGALRNPQVLGAGYGGGAFAAFHRYGISDNLTAGFSLEALPGYRAVGGNAIAQFGRFGTFSINHGRSMGEASGTATAAGYAYSGGNLSAGTNLLVQSRNFGRYAGEESISLAPGSLRRQFASSLSLALDARQSVGIDMSRTDFFGQLSQTQATLRYGINLFNGVTLNASLTRRDEGPRSGTEAGISLSINLDRNWNLSLRTDTQTAGGRQDSLRLTRAVPGLGGIGGRLALDRAPGSEAGEVFLQHNGDTATVSASARYQTAASAPRVEGGEVRIAGALAVVDGGVFASRSIDQSFAVISAGGLPDVRVYQNNQLVGLTREDGRLIVPGLAAYTASQLRLDDRDIPLDVQLAAVSQTAVPRALSGTVLRFAARRVASASGILVMQDKGRELRAAGLSLLVEQGERRIRTSTGPDGDFYLEDLEPGDYRLTASGGPLSCVAGFVLPAGHAAHTELGELRCE